MYYIKQTKLYEEIKDIERARIKYRTKRRLKEDMKFAYLVADVFKKITAHRHT